MLPRTAGKALPPALALALLSGCLQSDQALPFALDEGATVTRSVGPAGGTVSLAGGVALTFPPGALRAPTQITLGRRLDTAFPGDAGRVVPGTVFDVAPAGLELAQPVRVTLRLPTKAVPTGDAVRLGVARAVAGRADLAGSGSYDATSGLLTASLNALGPVAAVVGDDAIPLGTGTPPTLGGGSFATGGGGAPEGAGTPGGPGTSAGVPDGPLASVGAQRFVASCRPEARRCFSSGLVQVWASAELRERLGGDLVILVPRLEADLTFTAVGPDGLPGEALGSVSIRGTLRASIGQGIASYEVDETFRTGSGAAGAPPSITTVRISGNQMTLSRTTDGNDRRMEYELVPVGTGRMLTLRVEEEVELENDDGSVTRGKVILFTRLRG